MGRYTSFVGIDVSKRWIDIAVLSPNNTSAEHIRVSNDVAAIFEFTKKLAVDLHSVLFCMEDNGPYCHPFLEVVTPLSLHAWLENPLRIKRSLGLIRGKTDKLDSIRIAEYACRFQDKVILWKEEHPVVAALREMQTTRDLLIKIQTQLKLSSVQGKEKYLKSPLKAIHESIKDLEKRMKALIRSDPRTKRQYQLLTSIPGIGPIVSVAMIVATHGFTRMTDPRKLSCYAGIAPFPHTSGTTMRSTPRISKIGNPKLKALLHIAAMRTIKNIPTLREYYDRKLTLGKNKMSVLNAVRNKVVAMMLSVIRRDTPFVTNYQNPINERLR